LQVASGILCRCREAPAISPIRPHAASEFRASKTDGGVTCTYPERLVADLERDTSPRLVLAGLVAAARKLHQRLEAADPILRLPPGGAA
jgi:hypothetical protein